MATAIPPIGSTPPQVPTPQVKLRIIGPLLIVLAAFALSIFVYGILKAFSLSDDSANVIAGFFASAAILGFGLLARANLPAHERRQVTSPRWKIAAALGIGVALGIGARIGIGIVVTLGQAVDPGLCRKILELDDDLPTVFWHKLLVAIALVVLAPLGEELVFRGLLLRGLVRRMSFPVAAVISGVLFGVSHVQYWALWPLLVGICGFGVAAAYIYRTMGYPANVMMHAVFNGVVAVILLGGFDVSQEGATCE
jgi:uncharacterized protein